MRIRIRKLLTNAVQQSISSAKVPQSQPKPMIDHGAALSNHDLEKKKRKKTVTSSRLIYGSSTRKGSRLQFLLKDCVGNRARDVLELVLSP